MQNGSALLAYKAATEETQARHRIAPFRNIHDLLIQYVGNFGSAVVGKHRHRSHWLVIKMTPICLWLEKSTGRRPARCWVYHSAGPQPLERKWAYDMSLRTRETFKNSGLPPHPYRVRTNSRTKISPPKRLNCLSSKGNCAGSRAFLRIRSNAWFRG